ncbi:MAG: hypothetical protein ACRDT8_02830, partial [Micromonosporaceae bacterium]
GSWGDEAGEASDDSEPPSPPEPTYEGFDPGDQPLDDVVAPGPSLTPEEQAVALLQQTFGAERIDGSGARVR